jgi:hypothetical protein
VMAFYLVFCALPSSYKQNFLRFVFAVYVGADFSLAGLVAA